MYHFNPIITRIKYILTASHRKGHGVHSPYLFRFLNNVIFEKKDYYCYETLNSLRKKLSSDNTLIETHPIGTQKIHKKQAVKDILKLCCKPTKQAELLHRICVDMNAKTIIELGTNIGMTTLYLASCDKTSAKVYTFEGSKNLINLAKNNFNAMNFKNIEIIDGDINNTLDTFIERIQNIDFIFFDANHSYDATIRYFNICKTKKHENSIFVIDDIHRNSEMEKAWKYIQQDKETTASIDIYHMGIIWFNPYLPKTNLIIPF